jgi:acetyl esterase/lipase
MKYRHLITFIHFSLCSIITTTLNAQETNLNEDYSKYLSEVRKLNEQMKKGPNLSGVKKEHLLAYRNTAMGEFKTTLKPSIMTVAGMAGGVVPLLVYKPEKVKAVVLSIHGGGWYAGSAKENAAFDDELACNANVAVLSVDYRLAPENPFPACIEDCKATAKWLIANCQKEFGTDKIFLSGNSAGAHLAALTTLYIRDELKAIDKIKGVNFVYGVYDLGLTPSCRNATDSSMLAKPLMNIIWDIVFSGWELEQLQSPKYSPLYADLKGLVPALFTVGAEDPLVDDSYFMEVRWRIAGNRTFLAVYPESAHGFDAFPTKLAKVAREKMHQWIIELSN